MQFRNLSEDEILNLEKNNCQARNWSDVQVGEHFNPLRLWNVQFTGKVKIGNLDGTIKSPEGAGYPSGIRNTTLDNVTIGNNVYIADVRYLKSYTIDDHVWIRNVGSLSTSERTGFGNGVKIDVLNEAGGRELMLYEDLSAQIAYLLVLYRHDEIFITEMEKLISRYVESKTKNEGYIGTHAVITDTTTINNVNIGSHAHIEGAQLLREGTIRSRAEASTSIGEAVIAEKFIIHTGSNVDGGALLHNCFIGQSVQIGRQFSAENSVFFANSEGFHGEACSLFAGPYTVTHHKSTLLIAGLVSFYNAGSGTNQSNHMYKLGPVHQGIMERGCKTGSFSYLLWPSHVGAFSAVIGKHFTNFDASELPFSYITEENGKSVLTPAMNLFTVGTRRDSAKWPKRDKRKDPEKLDLIHFELFNPYTIDKVLSGIRVLAELMEKSNKKQEFISYKGLYIKRLLLKTCAKYYEMAISIFIGQKLLEILRNHDDDLSKCLADIRKMPGQSPEPWRDICGMIITQEDLSEFTERVKSGEIGTLQDVMKTLRSTHEVYQDKSLEWAIQLLCDRLQKKPRDLNEEDLKESITGWAKNSVKLNNMILKDAEKEFDRGSRIGYGIDGSEQIRQDDFQAVRGTYDENGFVKELLEENENIKHIMEVYG